MNFWIRNIVIGAVLIGLAYFFLANQDLLLSLDQEISTPEAKTPTRNKEEGKDQYSKVKEDATSIFPNKGSKNPAAEGLSRFYANLNPDFNKKGPKIRNNIVYLPDPKGDLVKLLEGKRMVTRPFRKSWRGTKANRPFRLGETILQKLSQYANEDGLEIIWWLNRDFLVKSPFRINKNVIQTAYQLGKSIEGHFQNGVDIYFCYQQRTIVVIEEDIPYLDEECTLLQPKEPLRR